MENRGGEGVKNVKEMRGRWRRRERKKIKGEGVKWFFNGGYEFDLIRIGVMKREVGKEWWEKRGGKKGEIEDNNVSESGRGRGRKIRRKKRREVKVNG